ncbi:MAG: HIT domain-containing protein [Nitrospirae bacterium]|nr:HIT domain-containing protein [Nitrospirota bacterium]
MKRLWSPWRMKYILNNKTKGCVLCKMPDENKDRKNYMLYRSKYNYVIMNIYPYNNGHLMVVPYKHTDTIEGLDDAEIADFMKLTGKSVAALKKAFSPDGFNIGMNLMESAGAGIEAHIHMHIVPRWNGDTSFMPVLFETRVIPEHLDDTYMRLLPFFLKSPRIPRHTKNKNKTKTKRQLQKATIEQ